MTVNYRATLERALKSALYFSSYGNLTGAKNRKALTEAIRQLRNTLGFNFDLRTSNKEMLRFAARFLGVAYLR